MSARSILGQILLEFIDEGRPSREAFRRSRHCQAPQCDISPRRVFGRWRLGSNLGLWTPSRTSGARRIQAGMEVMAHRFAPHDPREFSAACASEKSVQDQLNTIVRLFKEADEIICATDAGREGELIFRYILTWAKCEKKPFKRLWISSLTKEAIAKGFEKLEDGHKFDPLYHAAKCRSEADWIVGLNSTRFFTVEYGKRNLLLSIGRVQTPILAMIVGRDHEIEAFDSSDYWEIHTIAQGRQVSPYQG